MITFIRHCECYVYNSNGSINYMRVNPSLTKDGILRAKTLNGVYDKIILSPMSRCIETFIYSGINGPREINENFREYILCPGDFHENDEIDDCLENNEIFKERINKSIDYLNTLNGNICVITHSGWLREALQLNYIPNYGESIIVNKLNKLP